jgi:peptidylprolyl isomerase
MFRRNLIATLLGATLATSAAYADSTITATKLDPANTVNLDLKQGRVVIELRPDLAPKMVARFKQLCHEHFYDGTPFHRVIDGFMAQGGDPTGTGEGGSKYPNVPSSPTASSSCGAPWVLRALPIRTARTASSSSCSRRPHISMAHTRSLGR